MPTRSVMLLFNNITYFSLDGEIAHASSLNGGPREIRPYAKRHASSSKVTHIAFCRERKRKKKERREREREREKGGERERGRKRESASFLS